MKKKFWVVGLIVLLMAGSIFFVGCDDKCIYDGECGVSNCAKSSCAVVKVAEIPKNPGEEDKVKCDC
ncbi:MAG: hypothetical protein LBQ93_00630 [Treponema sp.]|jgi:uncharacterized Fe-S radical SAM superfamily protein PflX|nr:hypothetical protein [Treponema sp.]